MPTDASSPKRSRVRRVLRIAWRVLWIAALAVLGVLAIVALLVALPGVRTAALERVVRAVDESLPGTFEADARWPGPGRIELRRVRWTVDGERILSAARIDLDVALAEAFDRDVVVREVVVEDVVADVEAIGAATAGAAETAPAAPDTTAAPTAIELPWIRPGAIEGLPSVAVRSLSVREVDVVTAAATIVLHDLSLRLDARPGRTDVARLDLDTGSEEWGRLRGGLSLVADDSLRVRFDVWDWVPPGEPVTAPTARTGLRIALPSDLVGRALGGDVDVIPTQAHGVVVEGRPVDLALSARWTAEGVLQAAVDLGVPRRPEWAEPFLAGTDSTARALFDRVLSTWPDEGTPYGVEAELAGRVVGSDVTPERAELRASLPGPGHVLEAVDVADPARTTLDLDARAVGGGAVAGSLSLSIPDWVDLRTRGLRWNGARGVSADSLTLTGPGLALDGDASYDDGAVDGDLALRLRAAPLFERLAAWIDVDPWRDLPARLDVDATVGGALPRPELRVRLAAGAVDGSDALRLRALHLPDSLDATVDVRAEPLRSLLPDSLLLVLDDSTIERVQLGLAGRYDLADTSARARIGLGVRAEEGLLRFAAEVGGDVGGTVSVRVDTLRGAWRDLDIRSARPITIDADATRESVLLDGLDLTGSLGTIRGNAAADTAGAQGRMTIELALARERLLEWAPDLDEGLPPADSVKVRVVADLAGTSRVPVIDVEGDLGFVSDEVGDLAVTARVGYDEVGTLDAGLLVAGEEWLRIEGRVPADLQLAPFAFALRADDTFRFDVESPRLDLARLAERVDSPVVVEGDLTIDLQAEGPFGTMVLDGSVRSDRARVDLPDGSWLETDTSIEIAGDLQAPRVDGALTVERGLVILPEVPASRLPTDGEALLWEALAAARDTTAAEDDRAVSPLDTFTVPLPDVEMALAVPGGLRVRGHGLDVELRGRVEAIVEDGVPGLSGSLSVWRGSLNLLGRRFAVETGTVTFDPDQVEPDPALDIRLATELEGRRYTVTVTGTSTEPRIELGSEPEMPEGDIVSALLFGRPLDELDEGQSELLAQRTRDIAAAYGAAVLSQRVGQRLGVDILSIQPGAGDEAASLVVGQYLSPDVVIQYEQILEEGAAALVRLEYTVTRSLLLETVASQGDHSGVQLQWRRDY